MEIANQVISMTMRLGDVELQHRGIDSHHGQHRFLRDGQKKVLQCRIQSLVGFDEILVSHFQNIYSIAGRPNALLSQPNVRMIVLLQTNSLLVHVAKGTF